MCVFEKIITQCKTSQRERERERERERAERRLVRNLTLDPLVPAGPSLPLAPSDPAGPRPPGPPLRPESPGRPCNHWAIKLSDKDNSCNNPVIIGQLD